MIITKHLPIASLEVNVATGKIWLNAPHCVLRIKGLSFINETDQFSTIDIIDNKASMIDSPYSESNEELMNFLVNAVNFLKHEMDNNQNITNKENFLERIMLTIRNLVESDYRN